MRLFITVFIFARPSQDGGVSRNLLPVFLMNTTSSLPFGFWMMRRSEIIDQVLVENPELDLYELTKKVLEKHLDPSISVVIACQTCNKKLECVRGVEKTTK